MRKPGARNVRKLHTMRKVWIVKDLTAAKNKKRKVGYIEDAKRTAAESILTQENITLTKKILN